MLENQPDDPPNVKFNIKYVACVCVPELSDHFAYAGELVSQFGSQKVTAIGAYRSPNPTI